MELVQQYKKMQRIEEQILQQVEEIKVLEKKILGEEEVLTENEKETATGIRRLQAAHKTLARRLALHKSIYSVLLAVGVVLISRGVWELSAHMPLLSSSWISLLVGAGILLLLNKNPNLG